MEGPEFSGCREKVSFGKSYQKGRFWCTTALGGGSKKQGWGRGQMGRNCGNTVTTLGVVGNDQTKGKTTGADRGYVVGTGSNGLFKPERKKTYPKESKVCGRVEGWETRNEKRMKTNGPAGTGEKLGKKRPKTKTELGEQEKKQGGGGGLEKKRNPLTNQGKALEKSKSENSGRGDKKKRKGTKKLCIRRR